MSESREAVPQCQVAQEEIAIKDLQDRKGASSVAKSSQLWCLRPRGFEFRSLRHSFCFCLFNGVTPVQLANSVVRFTANAGG